MFALHARYRGREVRRANLVKRSASALSTMDGVGEFIILGVEDICAIIDSPEATTDVAMALLSAGDWAVGIGIASTEEKARSLAGLSLGKRAKVGAVSVRVDYPARDTAAKAEATVAANDIMSVFALLSVVLSKRTLEGREATSLMRSGYNQVEAAEELGISKQAMSQRLQAAGWQAETAGWQLAVNLLARANN